MSPLYFQGQPVHPPSGLGAETAIHPQSAMALLQVRHDRSKDGTSQNCQQLETEVSIWGI